MKIQKHKTFTTIPKRILEDTSISLRAKGYYACMMSGIDVEDNESFEELKEKGYIELKKNEYVLLISPTTKTNKVESTIREEVNDEDLPFSAEPSKRLKQSKKKKKPLPEVIKECVYSFTPDENERTQLMRYFNLRLYPSEDSKFSEYRLKSKSQIISILNTLNDCPTRIESIIQSIDKEWFKFYPYHKDNYRKNSRDNTMSSSLSEEELLSIKSQKETF